MYKQSPIRTHNRSKGIKVKHILQICLLLAVCFWLVYQVKHSQEKRKEFDAKDGKVVGNVQSDSDTQRLGRKDHPRVTSLATDGEQHGEDEDEKDLEDEPEKDDNRHEEDLSEKEDNGHEEHEIDENETEKTDAEPEHEEHEIDENETEKTDAEPEHEDESVDEDNERISEEHHTEREEIEDLGKEDLAESEEKEDASKEDHTENESVKKDQSESNTRSDAQEHEARDAHYRADDASSEVAQNTQTVVLETGNFTTGKESEMFGKVNFGEGNETTITSDKDDSFIQSEVVQPGEDIMNSSVSSLNATAIDEIKYDIRTEKLEEIPSQNSTLPSAPNHQTDKRSNSTANILAGEDAAREGEERSSKPEVAEAGSNKTEIIQSNSGEFVSNTTEDLSQKPNMAAKEDTSLSEHAGKKLNNNVQYDVIGQSNTSALTQVEEESRMEVGSLPKIRTEVQGNIDAVAE